MCPILFVVSPKVTVISVSLNYLNVSMFLNSGVHAQLCVGVCPCLHDILKSLFTYAQVLIWAFVCSFDICLSWSVWATYICGCVCVYVCGCYSVSLHVKILRTKQAWTQCPSRRYVALLWNRPSSRSRSTDSTPPLGGREVESDVGLGEGMGWHQGNVLGTRQI